MSYIKFPIVFWQDSSGRFTAAIASGVEAHAVADDLKKCRDQLKKYVAWKYDRDPYTSQPQFKVGTLAFTEVAVRPGHMTLDGRHFPSEAEVRIEIPYVFGTRSDDSLVCFLPSLGQTFFCRDHELLETLVADQVRQSMQGMSPNTLVSLLPPASIGVDSINVQIRTKDRPDENRQLEALENVATRLASRTARKSFARAWERDAEIEAVLERLNQTRGNLLLVGPPGSGKTTILVNAIRKLGKIPDRSAGSAGTQRERERNRNDDTTPPVADRFWSTSADRLISGMQYLGQWEERVEDVINELSSVQGVLCVENLQQLVQLGGREPVDSIAAFLGPFLANNELRMVAEATPSELDSCRRLLPGFDSLFQIMDIQAPERQAMLRILTACAEQYGRNNRIDYEVEAAGLCLQLFRRFMPYASVPGRCVEFWNGLFERLRADKLSSLTRGTVIDAFIRLTGLPEPLVCDEYSLPPDEIRDWFGARIIDQPLACENVTQIITRFKAGLNDPARPVGVQLFCGPTGVGKTQMAKSLAEYLFGSGEPAGRSSVDSRLVRLDMSEYSGYGAAERLVTQADGQPSKFIQRLREQPFVIVLLDEIEKAAAEVFDVLMGVFDEGRLTDRWGRVTDFRSSIILMTSNLGVRRTSPVGFDASDESSFESAVRRFFRPEFYNRFDGVVSFRPLGRESIEKIAEIELAAVARRDGLVSRSIDLEWDESVTKLVAKNGFNPRLGARPLQRAIERMVAVPVARLLAESPSRFGETIRLTVDGDSVIIV